jgi:hypothetical protein
VARDDHQNGWVGLKAIGGGVDDCHVRLDRLVIDSGRHSSSLEFHAEATVVGGLDAGARRALAGELIDALAGARPGVHLELGCGRRELTVFRPAQGRHRVVDTGAVVDVTEAHLGSDGAIDLFAAIGVDRALARRTMLLTSDDLSSPAPGDAVVTTLADADQDRLWRAAEELRKSEIELGRISGDTGASSADAALMDAVEKRHSELVDATRTYERIRLISLTIADVGAIGGIGLLITRGLSGIPFLVLAAAGALLGLVYRWRVREATRAEREVLHAAGADDYTSFHVERVGALLDGDDERRRFMQAVGDHRRAAAEWAEVAGDVPLEVALRHRDQIGASAELRTSIGSLQYLSEGAGPVSHTETDELAQALLARVEAVRALTPGEETVPMVVDEPFADLPPAMKPMLLELLLSVAGKPQLVVLTGDEDVTSWARIEAMTGRLAVVEPVVQRSGSPA